MLCIVSWTDRGGNFRHRMWDWVGRLGPIKSGGWPIAPQPSAFLASRAWEVRVSDDALLGYACRTKCCLRDDHFGRGGQILVVDPYGGLVFDA